MPETHTKGEMHGCVVCGKPYQLYVVYDAQDKFVDCKVMSVDARRVPDEKRPLVACSKHSDEKIAEALAHTSRLQKSDDE